MFGKGHMGIEGSIKDHMPNNMPVS